MWALSGDFFKGTLYTMAAVSTGGFAPHDDSLAGLGGWPARMGVVVLCLLGAVPFSLYHRLFRDRFRHTPELSQVVALVSCGLFFSVVFGYCLWRQHDYSWGEIVLHAPVMAFSAQTTAGFSTLSLSSMDNATKVALIPAMAIGGGMGSTAGGIKILRLLILVRLLQSVLTRMCATRHAVVDVHMGRHKLEARQINDALLLMLLFAGAVMFSWMPFVILGYPPLDSLFEVVSATGTVGLSAGVTAEWLPTSLKAVLCADMLLGRLEIFAWLVVVQPRTWVGRRMH